MVNKMGTNSDRFESDGLATNLEVDGQPSLLTVADEQAPGAQLPDDAMILLPVRNTVIFPGMVVPLIVGRKHSIAAAQEAARRGRPLGVLQQRDADVEHPAAADLSQVGTVTTILRYLTAPDGGHHVICQATSRFRVREFIDGFPFFVARVDKIREDETTNPDIEARLHHLKRELNEAFDLMPEIPKEVKAAVDTMSAPGGVADLIAGVVDLKPSEKQEILETVDVKRRLDRVNELLEQRLVVLRLSAEINKQTKDAVDKTQREYILREQLKAIRRELGESEGRGQDFQELAAQVAKAKMPVEVSEHVTKELGRLERMSEASAEYGIVRTYIEWMIDLPWSSMSEENLDIAHAREVLNEDHFGLDKVKKRILEHLAVHKLNPAGKGPILCFIGPPGVGKTSLGQSIAKATGRKFARVALGGLHDEAEIRGHRRTYVGALPGTIIQALRKVGTRNPVMLLDELDKVSAGFHGDPAAALLEVLDPEQNNSFRDNYLGVPFDLSQVMFIATANVLDQIPGPLRDRMEVIELPGYTTDEKVEIAKRYLVPKQANASGLSENQCQISDDALKVIVQDYTREAGCRQLEQKIGKVFRHVALRVAENATAAVCVDRNELAPILGSKRFEREVALRTSVPGVATGLAWTPVGGDILFVEASQVNGSGRLILTGQLGDVMKESAQAALTLLKARARSFDLVPEAIDHSDIHVHVPAGAIPKDGPSAGITMFIAMMSLFGGRTVRSDVAMTGEISLRGLVLPVGGIKEKCLAAAAAGIKTIMLPARNRPDIDDIPQTVRDTLEFVWLESVDDAVHKVFKSG